MKFYIIEPVFYVVCFYQALVLVLLFVLYL